MEGRNAAAHRDAELAETVEAEGWAARHLAVDPEFRTRFGTEIRRYGAAVAMLTRYADYPSVNRVFLLGLRESLTIDVLDAIVTDFRAAGVSRMVLHWGPEAAPAHARDWFAARGFRELRPMAILRRRAALEGPHTPLRIVEIDRSGAATYERIVAETLAETSAHENPPYCNMRRVGFEDLYLRATFLLDLSTPA